MRTSILPKRFRWKITNQKTGKSVYYNSTTRSPVTAEHALSSPSVKEWAQGAPLNAAPSNSINGAPENTS